MKLKNLILTNQVAKIKLIKVELGKLLLVNYYMQIEFRFQIGFLILLILWGGGGGGLKLMLTQSPPELELGLSLAKKIWIWKNIEPKKLGSENFFGPIKILVHKNVFGPNKFQQTFGLLNNVVPQKNSGP